MFCMKMLMRLISDFPSTWHNTFFPKWFNDSKMKKDMQPSKICQPIMHVRNFLFFLMHGLTLYIPSYIHVRYNHVHEFRFPTRLSALGYYKLTPLVSHLGYPSILLLPVYAAKFGFNEPHVYLALNHSCSPFFQYTESLSTLKFMHARISYKNDK